MEPPEDDFIDGDSPTGGGGSRGFFDILNQPIGGRAGGCGCFLGLPYTQDKHSDILPPPSDDRSSPYHPTRT